MRTLERYWRDLNDSNKTLWNIAYTVGSALVISRIDTWFQALDVDWSSNLIPRGLLAIVVAIIAWWLYRRIRGGDPLVFQEIEESPAKSALIVFVSATAGPNPGATAAQSAIEAQKAKGKLRFCTLLYTADSERDANHILGIHPYTSGFHIQAKPIRNDRDPSDVYDCVCDAIRDARPFANGPDDILVDFTGGTKLATFAMAMAAQDQSVALQYIYTPFNSQTRKLEFSRSVPMLLQSIDETRLARQDNANNPGTA